MKRLLAGTLALAALVELGSLSSDFSAREASLSCPRQVAIDSDMLTPMRLLGYVRNREMLVDVEQRKQKFGDGGEQVVASNLDPAGVIFC